MESKTIIEVSTKPNESCSFQIKDFEGEPYLIAGEKHGEIEWDKFLKRFTYTPQKDYTGTFNLTFQSNPDNLGNYKSEAIVKINVANIFKPRARLIKIIGQELISNDVIALVELIKNSYDADAEEVEIYLNNVFSEVGEILVKDSGTGMTYEKIVNVWLEPATPDKRSKGENTFSSCYKRRFLGEKGIGRFAVHRLGDKIELITRAKTDCEKLLDYETKLSIDWSDFTEDKYLSEIPVTINKINKPETFINSSGTLIRITNIHPWKNLKAIRDAALKIRGLESPVEPQKVQLHENNKTNDPGINIKLKSSTEEINRAFQETKSLKELLETAFYKFSGIVDEFGNLIYEYSFNRPDLQELKRSTPLLEEYLPNTNSEWFEEHSLTNVSSPGQFEVNFYAWDLETATLRIAGLADYHRNIIKPNAGIRIYRDNFRVWPYGEMDDDWLGLDLKRLNTPKERFVSRNQVFGVIHISSIVNPKLQDQSNREGLIVNEQYEQFYQLVSSALSVFARERKADKVKIDKVPVTKHVSDIVTASIAKLRTKIIRRNHLEFYETDLNDIETAYKEKINDVLERYMMAAAIGISYSIPIHEMKLRLTSIKNVIDDLNENPDLQDKFIKQLSVYVQETEDIVKAVSSMMSRQRKQKVNLYKVAQNVQLLKESDLKKSHIQLTIDGDKSAEADAVPGLLNTAVLNLVDNAIYWLRAKQIKLKNKNEHFVPKIAINIFRNSENKNIFQICDNGGGFEDPFELLVEPYYSRKMDGLGLGLFLVNEIMSRLGGKLVGYNNDGAVIELIF